MFQTEALQGIGTGDEEVVVLVGGVTEHRGGFRSQPFVAFGQLIVEAERGRRLGEEVHRRIGKVRRLDFEHPAMPPGDQRRID